MDTVTMILIVVVVALIGLYLYNRSRPAARGAYDDPRARSSGSIGGGARAHDDPNVRSGGSIGGGARSYDDDKHRSGGSIGGENERTRMKQRGAHEQPQEEYIADKPRRSLDRNAPGFDEPDRPTRKRVDDEDVSSGGSFGGSTKR